MKKKMTNGLLAQFLLGLLLLTGCSTTLVAPYDPMLRAQLVRTSVEISSFWLRLQSTDATERQFNRYNTRYDEIEMDLLVLLKLNQMRPNNLESATQSQNLLTLWQQDITNHRQKDSFKDFLLKRRIKEYHRMFTAMLAAEDAKDMK